MLFDIFRNIVMALWLCICCILGPVVRTLHFGELCEIGQVPATTLFEVDICEPGMSCEEGLVLE